MAISIQRDVPGAGKLATLRAKTDRDLTVLFQRAVANGLDRVHDAEFDKAEAIYRQVARLLPLLELLPENHSSVLCKQAEELRLQLDQAHVTDAAVSL